MFSARSVRLVVSTTCRVFGGNSAKPLKRKPKARKTIYSKLVSGAHVPTEAEFKPQFVNGRWRQPKRSARVRAKMKKIIQLNSLDLWKPEFEPIAAQTIDRPPAGHEHHARQQKRLQDIKKNMEEMPERIAKYRKEVADARPPPGLRGYLQK